jgi:hypothetical protein
MGSLRGTTAEHGVTTTARNSLTIRRKLNPEEFFLLFFAELGLGVAIDGGTVD